MQAATKLAPVSQRNVWAGRIISALPALLMLFGVLVWAGLYLRDPRFRALIPLRRN